MSVASVKCMHIVTLHYLFYPSVCLWGHLSPCVICLYCSQAWEVCLPSTDFLPLSLILSLAAFPSSFLCYERWEKQKLHHFSTQQRSDTFFQKAISENCWVKSHCLLSSHSVVMLESQTVGQRWWLSKSCMTFRWSLVWSLIYALFLFASAVCCLFRDNFSSM